MHLFRVVVAWGGSAVVGKAVNVLHFDGSNQSTPPVAAILTAYQSLASSLPAGTTVTVPGTGDIIEDTTGSLTGVWSGSGGGTVTGTAAGPVAAGVGACVGWTTGGIVVGASGKGRKLRGRTFLVPIAGGAWSGTGIFQASALTQFQGFANSLMAAGPLAVWHRPTTVGGTNGSSYAVLSGTVHNKTAILTSRRD